jgi:hypothetical protein
MAPGWWTQGIVGEKRECVRDALLCTNFSIFPMIADGIPVYEYALKFGTLTITLIGGD